MPLRALIFAAVSTEAQATEDRASLDAQLEQCRSVCAARGWSIVCELSVPGHSRAYSWLHQLVADCPEYARLVSAIETDGIDLVVVRDYDRLWRTDALRAQLMTLAREHHVQVFSCNQPVEPVERELLADSDTARLSEVLFGFISEQENRTRTRRRKMGIEQGRVLRRGLHHATRIPYGYRRGPTADSAMLLAEPQATYVHWMYERRAEGWSTHRILLSLRSTGAPAPMGGLWSDSTVKRILHNEVYAGVAHWGAARNEHGAHPAIVDPDLWARVVAVNRNRTAPTSFTNPPLRMLSGLTKCALCGRRAGYSVQQHGRYRYIRCSRYAAGEGCVANVWRAEVVEKHVLKAVKAALADPTAWERSQREALGNGQVGQKIALLDAQLADARARYGRWDQLFESGGITANELLLHRQEIRRQLDAISAERTRLAESARAIETTAAQLSALSELLPELDVASPADLNRLLRRLIVRVNLYPAPNRHIEIVWL